MNLRRGITRLLIILALAAGLVALLARLEEFTLRGIGYFIVFWLALLVAGLVVGYCILYSGKLIECFLRMVFNKGESEGEEKSKKRESGFRELVWVTSIITGAIAFFLVPITSTSKETMPDHPINFVLSFSVFLVTFCLVWAFYVIVMFVVRGFADNGQSGSESVET